LENGASLRQLACWSHLFTPVYISLFLFYKPLILNSLFEVFAEDNSKQVGDTAPTRQKGELWSFIRKDGTT